MFLISFIVLSIDQPMEDPNIFLRQRPMTTPVVLVGEDNCQLCIGTMPVMTFAREDFHKGLIYLMAYYYALHLMYPKCASTVLLVLQTEVLLDAIHEKDENHSYKKSMSDWKKYLSQ